MAGRGRGRGRGLLSGLSATPGGVSLRNTELDSLADMVASLNLDCSSKTVTDVADSAMKMSTSQSLEDVINILYKRSSRDWRVAETVVTVIEKMLEGELTEEKKKIRTQLLSIIHNDYNIRDTIRADMLQDFIGCAAFLCQLFGKLRLPNGDPYLMLVDPVADVLSMLLDNKASNQEMECAACQLLAVGKLLKKHKTEKLTALMWSIKNIIVDGKGTAETRIELVTVIEANASDWTWHTD